MYITLSAGPVPEPIFKPVPEPISKALIEDSDRIFYDLETSGLGVYQSSY